MLDEKEVRQTMAEELVKYAKDDNRIVVLDADLMSCHATKCFKQEFPDRFINVGIAEANMVGVAAGMAAMGKIPFIYSFAPFATRRCYDQIFISVAYAKQPVKIVGSDPGIMAEANGGTHMPFEDMTLMRAIPKMVVFEPTDATMLKKALPEIINYDGPVYIRMFRKKADQIYDDTLDFKLGKACTLVKGNDVGIIASGIMVLRALEAAEILKSKGIKAEVLNVHTWKPIDDKAIVALAKKTGALVTCENHSVFGGLNSAVSEVCAEQYPVPIERIGVIDKFGEVGKQAYLSQVFNLTVDDIVVKAEKAISRKK